MVIDRRSQAPVQSGPNDEPKLELADSGLDTWVFTLGSSSIALRFMNPFRISLDDLETSEHENNGLIKKAK